MQMDREIGHATSYLANYPQLSYATPHISNFSVPYANNDIHNSASHHYNGYSRISENSIGANVPSSSIVAYGMSPHLQYFGDTSLPKGTKSIGGHSYAGTNDWKEKLAVEFKKLNSLHRELEERPHDLATIQAYEAYNKKREEERKAYNIRFSHTHLQNFGNPWPKETESVGGQAYPSWAEAKEKFMAHTNKDKPKLAGSSSDEFTTPTFEELPEEYRQAYEVLKKKRREEIEALRKKREEEDMREFHANLEKDL